jgi:hypothetical protein
MKRMDESKVFAVGKRSNSSGERMDIAQQQITSVLRQRHRLAVRRHDDFYIFIQKEIAGR